jgi:PilZ domain
MRVIRTAPGAFTVEFESEDEVREEHRANLSMGGLRLVTTETAPMNSMVQVTLKGPAGGEAIVKATVVAALAGALALAIDGNADALLESLLAEEKKQNAWDRIRALSQMEKILLAVKADRSDRVLLLQDNDPRVLLSVLRNPRLTVDEVVRVAKSPFLNQQIADVIVKTAQWMASLDVRLGLVHNPKTPQAFALRILPTLPEAEVRAIARSGTSMAVKTAALRQLQR